MRQWVNMKCISIRGVSWSLPVFSIKKTLNSQRNLKKILFKVLTIGFYTFWPSFRQIMNTIPKKPFLFQGKPFDEPFFDFYKIGEALLCEWVSHQCEKVIVARGEVWSRDGRFYSILLNHSILLPLESILESIIFGNDSWSIDSVSSKKWSTRIDLLLNIVLHCVCHILSGQVDL